MRTEIGCLFILSVATLIATSVVASKDQERFLISGNSLSFTTFTLLKTTTTFTSTYTSKTTCTTSTALLASCTTGRRRRGLFYDEFKSESRHRRSGLFYRASEAENNEETAFLPIVKNDPNVEVIKTSIDETSLVPLEIESGFSVPEGSPNRFLLAFGTSTVTSIVVSYSTVSLTAICSSTTGFPLCGGVGK